MNFWTFADRNPGTLIVLVLCTGWLATIVGLCYVEDRKPLSTVCVDRGAP